jgi:predicted enzyme related to lactoylglutathione lyase
MEIPGVGWLIYFNDPDGNMHGAIENAPAAA